MESKKKITIQDVAREAAASPSTVSRVLTGNAPVSDVKRAAIEAAIQKLGYRPSLIARSLKTQTTCTIGLLINDITNPFYSAVARGIEEEANYHGYNLILCNTNEDPERELHYLQVLQDKQVDGIIFGPTGENVDYIRQLAKQVPLVQIDRQLGGVDIVSVLVDNQGGAYKAVQHLIQQGHRRIAFLGWHLGITTSMERLAGYERALRDAGIPLDPSLRVISSHFSLKRVYELARRLLAKDPRPTALFAANNQIGLSALRAIRDAGLRIPDDVALIVFDDVEVFALTTPSISAVSQPAATIGRRAMKLLVDLIESPTKQLPEVTVLPTQLVLRESA